MKLSYTYFILASIFLVAAQLGLASTSQSESSEVDVYTDTELFEAICAQKYVIWIRADLDLREEHWPSTCKAPVVLTHNLTISGPLDQALEYVVSFNFMARKVVIPPYGELRLRHFTARNTRRGGGGEIDFVAYSPRGILWTDDLNKNQIICLHADPAKLMTLPLPNNFSQFANQPQIVTLWDTYCTPRQCWNEVLHYALFASDVNVGSDTETGGYVMSKINSSKTCDEFVSDECLQANGGDACIMAVINSFLARLTAADDTDDGGVNPLAIALPVALGGAALVGLVAFITYFLVRRRRRREAEAAAAAAAAAKLYGSGGDLESGGDGRGSKAAAAVRDVDTHSSGSKEIASGSSTSDYPVGGSGSPAAPGAGSGGATRGIAPPQGCQSRGTAESFGYESGGDMGRCLSAGHRGGGGAGSYYSGSGSASQALVEGVMGDGSTCSFCVGSPLGQGSFGVVFKGAWKGKPVAVKLILCDSNCTEQVATEVRLMTSEACRHPNLLRAYACMTRTRVVNNRQPGGQALQSAIHGLFTSSNRRRRTDGVQPLGSGALSAQGTESGRSSSTPTGELAETWIVSEFCDLGALAPHVHLAKRFLFPADTGATATRASASATTSVSGAAPAGASASGTGGPGGEGLRRPRLAPILRCLRDIAAGMAHLHAQNIVHGDLKLANVLLSSAEAAETSASSPSGGEGDAAGAAGCVAEEEAEATGQAQSLPTDGSLSSVSAPHPSGCLASQDELPLDVVAKVADFGLSRCLKEGQTHHSTKTVGTVTHMPPELLRSGKLTLSGDVYSYGIIMWELLTGSVPYRGLMYGEVVERVVVSHRRPEFPLHTPPEYRSLAERCWAADARARPTFAAVLAELEALLAAAPELQSASDRLHLELLSSPPPPASAEPGISGDDGEAAATATATAAAPVAIAASSPSPTAPVTATMSTAATAAEASGADGVAQANCTPPESAAAAQSEEEKQR